jgi:peptidyl-prolyl cis-trans isomerase SurA
LPENWKKGVTGGSEMKKYFTLVTALWVLFSVTGVSAQEEIVIEEIVAKVGGKIITRSEYNKRKDQVLLEMQEFMSESEYEQMLPRLDEKVLDDLISEALVEYKAAEYGLTVPETAIEEAIEQLKRENNITTQEEFQEALASIGLTEEELRTTMKNRFLRNSVLEEEVRSKIILTQAEIEEYYNEHREDYRIKPSVQIRQILFRSDQMARDEITAECNKIITELQAGGDFSEIAGRYADPGQETGDGILGPFSQGDLLQPIEDAAFSLPVGEVSGVIETQFGFYIIQVVSREPGGYQDLSEVSLKIREEMYRKMANEGLEEYLARLREEIYVEILSEP